MIAQTSVAAVLTFTDFEVRDFVKPVSPKFCLPSGRAHHPTLQPSATFTFIHRTVFFLLQRYSRSSFIVSKPSILSIHSRYRLRSITKAPPAPQKHPLSHLRASNALQRRPTTNVSHSHYESKHLDRPDRYLFAPLIHHHHLCVPDRVHEGQYASWFDSTDSF